MTRGRRLFSLLLLSAAAILATPLAAWAQSGGERFGNGALPTGNHAANLSWSAPDPPDRTAHVRLLVPSNAKIWFGDALMESTGVERDFRSPPLKPFVRYEYVVKVRWMENGREVTQTLRVPVAAGDYIAVKVPISTPERAVAAAATR